jgi:hypothetical protein
MRGRRAGAIRSGERPGRHDARGRGADRAGWRSHAFGDGACSITLTAALDAQTADRLRVRMRELCERGCERLIVDVTSAGVPEPHAPGLLASVFRTHLPNCEIVVIVPRGSSLDRLLPARIAVAWSLTDARRLLDTQPVADRAAPASTLEAGERHALAVRQALRWAEQTAGTGDYESALRGLATIELVEGALSERWQARRQAWLAASRSQVAAMPPRRDGAHLSVRRSNGSNGDRQGE